MTEQPTDHQQGLLVHRRMAGECVLQVVNPKAGKSSLLAELPPVCVDRRHGATVGHVPEHPLYLIMTRNRVDHGARLVAKPDLAGAAFAVAKLDPVAAYVFPVESHDLAPPAAGEDEQCRRFRGERAHRMVALALLREHIPEALQFFMRQKPLA